MKVWTWCAILLTALFAAHSIASGQPTQGSPAKRPIAISVLMHDTLQPVSSQMLREQLAAANDQHPAAIIVDLSTPGGWSSSAIEMAEAIRRSPIPVLVYVRDPGTQIAGEGFRLLSAGAASAVNPDMRLLTLPTLSRGNRAAREVRDEEVNTLVAAVADAATARGADAAWIAELMRGDRVITPQAAREAGLVDVVTAKDETALRALAAVPPGRPEIATARVIMVHMTARQHLMRALMNPDLAVLLLTLGALLIYLEINTPGTILPGAAGVLLVLLSLFALLQMPLRWQGVLLLVLSAAMLFAETQLPRGSSFGIAAVITLTLGLRLLVKGPIPELQVDWSTSVGAGVGFGGITAGLVLLGARARRAKIRVGADAMLGWLAVAQTSLQPTGEVLVRGELWRARLSEGNSYLRAGECVRVQSTDGVTLEVAPMALQLQENEAAFTL